MSFVSRAQAVRRVVDLSAGRPLRLRAARCTAPSCPLLEQQRPNFGFGWKQFVGF